MGDGRWSSCVEATRLLGAVTKHNVVSHDLGDHCGETTQDCGDKVHSFQRGTIKQNASKASSLASTGSNLKITERGHRSQTDIIRVKYPAVRSISMEPGDIYRAGTEAMGGKFVGTECGKTKIKLPRVKNIAKQQTQNNFTEAEEVWGMPVITNHIKKIRFNKQMPAEKRAVEKNVSDHTCEKHPEMVSAMSQSVCTETAGVNLPGIKHTQAAPKKAIAHNVEPPHNDRKGSVLAAKSKVSLCKDTNATILKRSDVASVSCRNVGAESAQSTVLEGAAPDATGIKLPSVNRVGSKYPKGNRPLQKRPSLWCGGMQGENFDRAVKLCASGWIDAKEESRMPVPCTTSTKIPSSRVESKSKSKKRLCSPIHWRPSSPPRVSPPPPPCLSLTSYPPVESRVKVDYGRGGDGELMPKISQIPSIGPQHKDTFPLNDNAAKTAKTAAKIMQSKSTYDVHADTKRSVEMRGRPRRRSKGTEIGIEDKRRRFTPPSGRKAIPPGQGSQQNEEMRADSPYTSPSDTSDSPRLLPLRPVEPRPDAYPRMDKAISTIYRNKKLGIPIFQFQ